MLTEKNLKPTTNRGVYFLADDGVIDFAIAFLNSFRKYNPQIQLCLIPFAPSIDKLQELQSVYNFSIYTDQLILQRCDDISRRFHPYLLHHYRKLAMWEGEFDEFIYIDLDTVVLSSIEFVFPYLKEYGFVTSHSNIGINKTVWRESINQAGKLTDSQIAFSANTGFVASRKGALSVELAEQSLPSAVELASHMALECMEQPFLNYLIVNSPEKFSSLYVLSQQLGLRDMPLEHWAGRRGAIVRGGQIFIPGEAPVLLVHWAGVWKPHSWWDWYVYNALKKLRLVKDPVPVNPFMPYRSLWNFYRRMHLDR